MTPEENEFLTRTGPGTAMGALFRRYWIPALVSEELPEPDCPPVRITLLWEKLLAFRESLGRLEPHRLLLAQHEARERPLVHLGCAANAVLRLAAVPNGLAQLVVH